MQGAQGRIEPRSARPNEDTRFTYTLWTESNAEDSGFDLMRFALPAPASEVEVHQGDEPVEPASIAASGDSLFIGLPTAITTDSVQVAFTTRVVHNATVFSLDLGSSERPGLWQSVEPATRRSNIVLLPELSGSDRLIDDLQVSTPVLTPNGDGIHDQVEIRFVPFKVSGSAARIVVYDVAGRRIAELVPGATRSPERRFTWSGRDESGRLVRPGIYLYRIDLGADSGEDSMLRALIVAY